MSEQRLIDANLLLKEAEESLCENPHTSVMAHAMHTHEHRHFMCMILHQPTIDPESLHIVRQLRAELERVKAERDAAIKSRAKLAEYELTVCEEFCYSDAQHDIPPCEWLVDGKCALREWVKEYA